MAPSRYHRDHRRSRSRSRSRSYHRRSRSRSNSYSDDDRRSSRKNYSRREREQSRVIRDEFGRELKQSDIHRLEKEIKERKQIEKTVPDKTKPEIKNEQVDEIEEGEDITASMKDIMGFGSFSSTKGKHVKDNDNLVNRGAVRKVKQFKAMRILNRKDSKDLIRIFLKMWQVVLVFLETALLQLLFYLVPSSIRSLPRNDSKILARCIILSCYTIVVILFNQGLLHFNTVSIFELWGLTRKGLIFPVLAASMHICILYTGLFVEKYYCSRKLGLPFLSMFTSYSSYNRFIFLRDYLTAPICEELLHRGSILLFLLHNEYSLKQSIWLTSLSFGSCHLHHFFNYVKMGCSVKNAILSCLFMATYTTLFGVLVSYIYVRTGSILAAIVTHSICNYLSIPSFSFSDLPQRNVIIISYIVGIVLYICLFTSLLNPVLLKSSFLSLL